jgi:hypothetical protein
MVTLLPSECRQRKEPYLGHWDGKGGAASTFQGLLWKVLIPFIQTYAGLELSRQRGPPNWILSIFKLFL